MARAPGNHTEDASPLTGYTSSTEPKKYTNVVCMEPYVIRTEGGPHPGQRLIDGSKDWMTWPPPDILNDDGGHYEKVSQSGLPPMDPQTDRVIRGAMYTWVPDQPDDWVVGQEVEHELLARELVRGKHG